MSFNPSNVSLSDLYADPFQQDKTTKVYDNGKMQVAVYVAVSYYGPDTHSQQVINHVLSNAVICSQTSAGALVPLGWEKSTTSNEYGHDIERAPDATGVPSNHLSGSNIRVPLYFTVPVHMTGKHYWVAQLDGATSPTSNPVTVEVLHYAAVVCPDDIEIVHVLTTRASKLEIRAMQYKHDAEGVPSAHKLLKYISENGIQLLRRPFTADMSSGWLPLSRISGSNRAMAVFVSYKRSFAVFSDRSYLSEGPDKYGPNYYKSDPKIKLWKDGNKDINIYIGDGCRTWEDEIDQVFSAWDHGIVMALTTSFTMKAATSDSGSQFDLNYTIYGDYKVEDNFGNEFDIDIDFNAGSDYYQTWKVTKFDNAN